MLEMFSLKGKVAVITGASRGLGRTMAKGLAAAGAHVVLIARDKAKLDAVSSEIAADGGASTVLPIDLSDERAIRTGVQSIAASLGRIDICVNNAGIINWQPVLESDLEEFDRTMDTNVKATFIMAQECAAVMRKGGEGGRIINIGSVLSTVGRAKLHAYCASKSAIVGLTRSLAAELGRENITANVIAPGYFVTDINASVTGREGYVEAVSGVTPMERWGEPQELVGTLIYLASGASSFVTGQVIHVDGGISSTFKFQLAA
ncbi:SDR family oxidoreductase [Hoeflea sp. EC-HK425]|uniref:SDR family NAD(P)-dependent oxidoreductase n=1 Tax=Hoeflea sp. EC-HK425 TaxID=2038388 RepID=UPI0012537232|nr:SDR family oxidoreductase [Hoeflea sp. EC-HK425]VVT01160.1 Gluconate 5-dehydrogenase [Hoeflea sp. EC-HK425]